MTGGACGGKTESLPFIKEHFTKLGFDVYIVNEMATSLILGGITVPKVGMKNFQELVIRMQIEIQKTYEKAMPLSENNKARRDNGEYTVETDNRLLEAYREHPNGVIISSYKDFNEKIKK